MTIAEARGKCKSALAMIPRDVLIVSVLLLASSASFGLGFLAGIDTGQGSGVLADISSIPMPITATSSGKVVASKTGTKYYFLSCPGVNRISEANKTWFISAQSAERAGYALATNCKAP